MGLYINLKEDPKPSSSHIQETISGKRGHGAGSLAMQNKANFLLTESKQIAGDVRIIGDIMGSKTKSIQADSLSAVMEGKVLKVEELLDELTLTELLELKDAAFRLFCICKNKTVS